MSVNNFLTSGNFNLPSLGSSSAGVDSASITGSPLDYSGANENFLYDIGSPLTPSSNNGYNFGLGTGANSLINSSNSFINNTLTSGINEGIINPLDLSTSTLTNLANGQNATGQAILPTSTSNIFGNINNTLSSIGNDITAGASSLLGIKNITQAATGLFGLSSTNPNNYLTNNSAATNAINPQSGNIFTPQPNNSGIITDILIVGGLLVGIIIVAKIA